MIGSTLGCNKLITQVRPVYPREAKKKRIQGTVSFRAPVTKTGELRNIEVLKGDPLLIPAALKAVKQWRYTPCLLFNSEPVEIITQIDLNFNLNQ
jgi:protein TonB